MKRTKFFSASAAALSTALCTVAAQASSISISGGSVPSLAQAPSASEFSAIFKTFKGVGTAVSGICAITALIFFVINLTNLSTSAGNDMQRSRALKGILFSGLSLALFGSLTVVVGIFWNTI